MKSLNEKNQGKLTREEVKQEMLDYINKKYDMEFECESIDYADWYSPGSEYMTVFPKGKTVSNPEDTFLVKRYKYKEKVEITDGYVGYLNFPKYKELSTSIIKKYFPTAIGGMPRYVRELYPAYLTPESSYEEFKEYTDNVLRISHSIYIGYDGNLNDLEKIIESLTKDLNDVYPIGELYIYCYSNSYFEQEILSGNISLEDTDPETNTILVNRDISWGEIDHTYSID